MKKQRMIEIISALLIVLFTYAAISKLLDHAAFYTELRKSPLLHASAGAVTWLIPLAELIISLLIALKSTRLLGLYSSLFLLVVFTAYLIITINFSYYVPCSCGGLLSDLSWDTHILFNLFFIAINVGAIILESVTPPLKMNVKS